MPGSEIDTSICGAVWARKYVSFGLRAAKWNKEAPQRVMDVMNGYERKRTRMTQSKTITRTEKGDGLGMASLYKLEDYWCDLGGRWRGKSEAVFRAEHLEGDNLEKTRLKGGHRLPICRMEMAYARECNWSGGYTRQVYLHQRHWGNGQELHDEGNDSAASGKGYTCEGYS